MPSLKDLIRVGNIDIYNRPSVKNPETGGYSTVWSMSIGTPEGEVLIPRVADGKILSEDEAVDRYYRTGEHLGIFKSVKAAEKYAEMLHQQQQNEPIVRRYLNALRF